MKRFTKMLALGMAMALTFGMTVSATESGKTVNKSVSIGEAGVSASVPENMSVTVMTEAAVTEVEATLNKELEEGKLVEKIAKQLTGTVKSVKSVDVKLWLDIQGEEGKENPVEFKHLNAPVGVYYFIHFGTSGIDVIPTALGYEEGGKVYVTATLTSFSPYALADIDVEEDDTQDDPFGVNPAALPIPTFVDKAGNTVNGITVAPAAATTEQAVITTVTLAGQSAGTWEGLVAPLNEGEWSWKSGQNPGNVLANALYKEYNDVGIATAVSRPFQVQLTRDWSNLWVIDQFLLRPVADGIHDGRGLFGEQYGYDYGYSAIFFDTYLDVDGVTQLINPEPACIHELTYSPNSYTGQYYMSLHLNRDNNRVCVLVRWERKEHVNHADHDLPYTVRANNLVNRVGDTVGISHREVLRFWELPYGLRQPVAGPVDLYQSEYNKLYTDVVTLRNGSNAATRFLDGKWEIKSDSDILGAFHLETVAADNYIEFSGLGVLEGNQRYVVITYGRDAVRSDKATGAARYATTVTAGYQNAYEMKLVEAKHGIYATNELQKNDAFAVIVKVEYTGADEAPAQPTITAPAGTQTAGQAAQQTGVQAGAAVSPKTGEVLSLAVVLAAICLAGAAVCARKARCN